MAPERLAAGAAAAAAAAAAPGLRALVEALGPALSLGLEPLYLPCSAMKCGDAVYRASLDPSLRLEEAEITALGLGILTAAVGYLLVKPGILRGLFDYYVLNFVDRALFRRPLSQDDFKLGRVLGKGGFGDVYEAELFSDGGGGGKGRDKGRRWRPGVGAGKGTGGRGGGPGAGSGPWSRWPRSTGWPRSG